MQILAAIILYNISIVKYVVLPINRCISAFYVKPNVEVFIGFYMYNHICVYSCFDVAFKLYTIKMSAIIVFVCWYKTKCLKVQ